MELGGGGLGADIGRNFLRIVDCEYAYRLYELGIMIRNQSTFCSSAVHCRNASLL